MPDNLARTRPVSPSGIRAMLDKGQNATTEAEATEGNGPLVEKSDPLPRPGDDYRANARHGNKPEMTLHFVTKDFTYEGFSYADFERVRLVPGDKPGSGPVLIRRFNGSEITDVHVEGRQLHSLYHWTGLHQVSWIWEYPGKADFADDAAPIITKIAFVPVKR